MEFEGQMILAADDNEELNRLIDEKLKARYLLKGAVYEEGGKLKQEMILPGTIDNEMTMASGIKLLIGGTLYVSLLYFFF